MTSETPRGLILWTWAACRMFWISLFPAFFGALSLLGGVYSAQAGHFLGAALSGAVGLVVLSVGVVATRYVMDVVAAEAEMAEWSMRSEIRATFVLCGIGLVLSLIVAPEYSQLFRKSAEGAMKGRLVLLREAVARDRAAHGGRAPSSLDALVADGTLDAIPILWPRNSGIDHETTKEAMAVPDATPRDTGRWAYVVSPASPTLTGTVFIDCTHTDTRGTAWSAY